MSRIFPYEQRWVWGPLLVFALIPSMVANIAGASNQTVGGIVLAGFFVAAIVGGIFDPRGRDRAKPDA